MQEPPQPWSRLVADDVEGLGRGLGHDDVIGMAGDTVWPEGGDDVGPVVAEERDDDVAERLDADVVEAAIGVAEPVVSVRDPAHGVPGVLVFSPLPGPKALPRRRDTIGDLSALTIGSVEHHKPEGRVVSVPSHCPVCGVALVVRASDDDRQGLSHAMIGYRTIAGVHLPALGERLTGW